jgi:predicted unusual protein kinase regulating ubiquinone biosynthesis (AarF/ABC1/UbiB family)
MQSDPNFANYLYQVDTQRVVLLDFGACRYLTEHTSAHYLMMAKAMQHQNTANMHKALMALGLIDSNMSENVVKTIIEACVIASECLQTSPYHLKQKQLIKRIQKATVPLISDKTSTVTPKFDVALVNRKITGMILLANKLEVSLDFKAAIASYLTE